ncbi:MAG: MYXO-CTERM sorting domain-containing protein [Polyangiaceae bacterium]|nr:MYXO-CTERM sorting domain-containing protein [Polyangiaceae bacterium]
MLIPGDEGGDEGGCGVSPGGRGWWPLALLALGGLRRRRGGRR